jgi:glycosyltransferase involved in cell wall biosynthesis
LNQPLVSIGLPTYNRPEGLEKTIQYLLNQDYKNIDIFISDNCSTDNRVKIIVQKYSNIDSRVKYFIQNKNIEIEPNFNFVFHNAKGKYFMWLADDDLFEKNYINECVDFLENNENYLLCSGQCEYYKDGKYFSTERNASLSSSLPLFRFVKYFLDVHKNGMFYGVYRNSIKFESPIQKHIGADWCHIARVAYLGKIHVLENIVNKRSDDGGSSTRHKMTKRWKVNKLTNLFLETYTAYSISRNVFNEPILKSRIFVVPRIFIQISLFIFLNFKFLFNSIKKRL